QRAIIEIVVFDADVTGTCCRRASFEFPAPCGQAAVEDAHIGHARGLEHPPRACRPGPIPVVVHDDRDAVAHTPSPRRSLEATSRRQWMTPAAVDGMVGQLVVERYVDRTRQVAVLVGAPA